MSRKGNLTMPNLNALDLAWNPEPVCPHCGKNKASADMWAEQCRTLQRTLLDTQIERDALRVQLKRAQQGLGEDITRPHDCPERCPTYYDGCNCTVEVLVHNIERAKRAERRVAELEAGISTAMQLIEGGFDSAAYEALEALNAHK